MSPRELTRLAGSLQGKSAAVVDDELQRRGLSAEERIAVRYEMEAAARSHTLHAQTIAFEDEPRVNTPDSEVDRWLKRAGVQLHKGYSLNEIDDLLERSPFGPEQRIAMKIRLEERGLIAAAQPASRGTRSMSAAAEEPPKRGKLLVNQYGEPVTLQSVPD